MKSKIFQTLTLTAFAATFVVAQPPASQTTPQSQSPYPGQSQSSPSQTQPGYPPGTIPENPQQQAPGQQQQPLPQQQTPSTPQAATPTAAVSQIQDALQKQAPTLANKVTVSVTPDNGIQLSGTVDSQDQKDQAEQIARSAAPNQSLTNSIKVSSSAMPPSSPAPPVSQADGSKAGEATAEAEQQQTGAATGQYPGQSTSPSSSTPSTERSPLPPQNPNLPQAGATANSTSSDLQAQLTQAFSSDPSLKGAKVSANVSDTTVELTGNVADKTARDAAKKIAEDNSGGRKVVDHLTIGSDLSNPPLQ
jgi:osmotically-inducible protein OsmY